MPVLSCPRCQAINQLPDPWYAPGYTCHHCRQPVAIQHPPAPSPDPFADLSEPEEDKPSVRRRIRHATGDQEPRAHVLLILAGFLCAVASLFVFPPAFGVAGLIFGAVCVAQRSTLSGILIVILSGVCASVGMIWGIEAALFGRPKSFGGDQLPFPEPKNPLIPTTESDVKPSEGSRATAGKESAKLGGVSVGITSATVGKAKWMELGTEAESKDAVLLLQLTISTKDATKKIHYRTWRKVELFAQSQANLWDNFGNRYKLLHEGIFGHFRDAVETATVSADEPVSDLILFEKPLKTAEHLDLDLPGDAVGLKLTDVFRFRIPRAMWAK